MCIRDRVRAYSKATQEGLANSCILEKCLGVPMEVAVSYTHLDVYKRQEVRFMQAGKSSIRFEKPPLIAAAASVVGEKEGRGPLGGLFDMVERDPMFGMESWEEAESEAQRRASMLALKKGGLESGDVRYLFAGALLGRCV